MKKNSCRYKDLVFDYQLSLLDEKKRLDFETHLKECPVCQRELKIARAIETDLTSELKTGDIEGEIIKRLAYLRDLKPGFSLTELITPFVYAFGYLTAGIILLPIVINIPFDRLGSILTTFVSDGILNLIIIGAILLLSATIISFSMIGEHG
ncbi:MAG TPA: zf-HC2 domain-containing protein [bacterium (Candidatus Stahlbacteria)]|nr:zf-HC2 domain-containing protein [Candidatus Stahlbacteria bacterium]